jgi:type IV secretion system protein VirD4
MRYKSHVHFVLDEAVSLGHLDAIDDSVDKYRGYGVRLQFYFQSLGQVKTCFPDGQEQTLLSNASQIFFGVNDNATAEYVSARLGEETIIVESGGTSTGTSRQSSNGPQSSSSTSYSRTSSSNWQPQARKLLKPEEVMALSPRVAITFTPGMRPICTTLLRYYEEPQLFRGPTRWRRLLRNGYWLFQSFMSFLFAIMLSVALTMTVQEKSSHERNLPPDANKNVVRPRRIAGSFEVHENKGVRSCLSLPANYSKD